MVSVLMSANNDLKIEIDRFLWQKFITSFIRHEEGYNLYNHFLQPWNTPEKPGNHGFVICSFWGPYGLNFRGKALKRMMTWQPMGQHFIAGLFLVIIIIYIIYIYIDLVSEGLRVLDSSWYVEWLNHSLMLFSALVAPLIESTTAQLIVIAMPVSQLPSSNAEDNKVKLILKFLGCPIFRQCIPVASGGCLYSARDLLIVGCRCPDGSCGVYVSGRERSPCAFWDSLKWIPIIPTSLVQQVTKYLPFEVGTGFPKRCGLNLVDVWPR